MVLSFYFTAMRLCWNSWKHTVVELSTDFMSCFFKTFYLHSKNEFGTPWEKLQDLLSLLSRLTVFMINEMRGTRPLGAIQWKQWGVGDCFGKYLLVWIMNGRRMIGMGTLDSRKNNGCIKRCSTEPTSQISPCRTTTAGCRARIIAFWKGVITSRYEHFNGSRQDSV